MQERLLRKPNPGGASPLGEGKREAYVRLANVSKHYAGEVALDNISLEIHQGEFFALLGPSGCGKTTLLRMLAGFEAPDSGQIFLDGVDIAGVPPYRRPVNMMFQSYALFPHLSVAGNIAFGLKQEGLAKAEIQSRVDEALELVQLSHYAKRKPDSLSGGQRQRVALARCLVKRPKILLLDEPLGALDKKLREQTQFELVNIQEQLGITFIIVTHDQEEAMTMASRIAVMENSRIVQVAPPSVMYEAPNSRYVAEFLGEVNLFHASVQSQSGPLGEGQMELHSTNVDSVLRCRRNIELALGDQAWVALRPEKLYISREAPAETGFNCLQGQVWDIAYFGDTYVYHVKLANGQIVKAMHANRLRSLEQRITWEDSVYLSWDPAAAVILTK